MVRSEEVTIILQTSAHECVELRYVKGSGKLTMTVRTEDVDYSSNTSTTFTNKEKVQEVIATLTQSFTEL